MNNHKNLISNSIPEQKKNKHLNIYIINQQTQRVFITVFRRNSPSQPEAAEITPPL